MTPEESDDIISEHGWREARARHGLIFAPRVEAYGPPAPVKLAEHEDRPFARALARIQQDFAQ